MKASSLIEVLAWAISTYGDCELTTYSGKVSHIYLNPAKDGVRYQGKPNEFGIEILHSKSIGEAKYSGNPKKEIVAKEVFEILRELNGRPMRVADILEELGNRGLPISGKKPSAVLTAMLWRTKSKFNFMKHKDGGYYVHPEAA